MIKKMWKDIFNNQEAEDLFFNNPENKKEIIDILISDKIDPRLFISNIQVLIQGGRSSLNMEFDITQRATESISTYSSRMNIPPGVPLWFLAAYPDVLNWFNEQIQEYHNKSGSGNWKEREAELFGFSFDEKNKAEEKITDKNDFILPRYYKNLINNYKQETDHRLETKVKEGSKNDLYLQDQVLIFLGAKNNFTFIAKNTTKFYLEFKRYFEERFPNEYSLLAAAGILDTQYYLDEGSIKPEEILEIAKKSVESEKDSLVNFIVELEVRIFEVDSSVDWSREKIRKACSAKKSSIQKTISETKEKYKSTQQFFSQAKKFMDSSEFKSYRKKLNIIENNIFEIVFVCLGLLFLIYTIFIEAGLSEWTIFIIVMIYLWYKKNKNEAR